MPVIDRTKAADALYGGLCVSRLQLADVACPVAADLHHSPALKLSLDTLRITGTTGANPCPKNCHGEVGSTSVRPSSTPAFDGMIQRR
jgi:hypothetical protein